MERLVLPATPVLVPLLAVVFEMADTLFALGFVENAKGQDLPGRFNAVIDASPWNDLELDGVALAIDLVALFGDVLATLCVAAELAVLDVVRPPVLGVV